MSALSDAARDYLRLRNRLGHGLAEYHRELPRFVAALDAAGLPTVTVAAALAWAQERGVDPVSSVPARRMTIARGFARYLAGIDARTEVPPPGLIAGPQRWRPPFIYSPDDIAMLLAHARRLRQPMPAATHETLVGLLAVTGIRVGEALRLDRGDIDWACGVLAIRESKFGKSRRVPVRQSTLAALDRYAQIRDQFCTQTTSSSFLLSTTGTRLLYPNVRLTFRRLCTSAGIGADAPAHRGFTICATALRCTPCWTGTAAGADVEAQLPLLSTYLGHRRSRARRTGITPILGLFRCPLGLRA